jgi:hypothetical protein
MTARDWRPARAAYRRAQLAHEAALRAAHRAASMDARGGDPDEAERRVAATEAAVRRAQRAYHLAREARGIWLWRLHLAADAAPRWTHAELGEALRARVCATARDPARRTQWLGLGSVEPRPDWREQLRRVAETELARRRGAR